LCGFDVSRFKREHIRRLTSRDDFASSDAGCRFCGNLSSTVEGSCCRRRIERAQAKIENKMICQAPDAIDVGLLVFGRSEASIFREVSELNVVPSSSIWMAIESIMKLHSMILSQQQTSISQLSEFAGRNDN
jgi:hypothetical protein